MKDLSIVQKYFVCSVNEKGVFPFVSADERALCLVAAALLELQMEGGVTVADKKLSAAGSLPAGREYLRPLYDFIREKQPVKLHAVVDAYGLSFSDKRLHALRDAVGASLVEAGAAVCDDTAVLVVLLERAKCLKQYFSDYERKAIREKIDRIVDSPEGKLVKDMMDYLELFLYTIAARGAASAGGAG